MIWGSGGLKSRLAKAAGADPSGQRRDEKLHAIVARSTFGSQNVQNTSAPDHFWKLRCRKSARRCGAKHIWKSKCTKHTILGPLLEVEMSKKCTPLWREAHFQVKMYKTPQLRTTFGSWDVEKAHAVVARSISKSKCTKHHMFAPLLEVRMLKKRTPLWREAHFQVKMYKTLGVRTCSDHFWRFRCRFASLRGITLHYTLDYTTVHYITLRSTTLQLQLQNYTTTLHYIKLQYTTPHYTTLHYITLHYTLRTLQYTTLHSTTLQLQLQNYTTTLHYTPLRTATLNYTTLHYTTLERSIDR